MTKKKPVFQKEIQELKDAIAEVQDAIKRSTDDKQAIRLGNMEENLRYGLKSLEKLND